MSKTLTKAQLATELEASHTAYQALLALYDSATATKPAAPAAKAVAPAYKPRADISCPKCGGSGWYDQTEQRICFACEGKSYQTDADQRRNWGYKTHHQAAASAIANAAKPAYVPKAPTAEILAIRERMAKAKAAAMATGKVVFA
jgi:hypothetical protein